MCRPPVSLPHGGADEHCRPVIKESINGVVFDSPRHGRFDLLLCLMLEILYEQWNVGCAIAQRRCVDGQHRNSIKEILPESTCGNFARKVSISGRTFIGSIPIAVSNAFKGRKRGRKGGLGS